MISSRDQANVRYQHTKNDSRPIAGMDHTAIPRSTQVGAIGGNLVYAVKATEMFAIKPADAATGALSSAAAHGNDSNAFVSTLAKVNRRLNPTPRWVTRGPLAFTSLDYRGLASAALHFAECRAVRSTAIKEFPTKNCRRNAKRQGQITRHDALVLAMAFPMFMQALLEAHNFERGFLLSGMAWAGGHTSAGGL